MAARRVLLSLLVSWIEACVNESRFLISLSVSLVSAVPIAGSSSSSAPVCNSFAAARRTARSGAVSFSAAIAVRSSLRIRLLMTTSSRFSGSGVIAFPVNRSVAASPLTSRICASPTVCTSPSSKACSNGSNALSPLAAAMPMAFALASLSPRARSRSVSGANAKAEKAIALKKIAPKQRMIAITELR